jgi:hypothetical protein
MQLAAGPDLGMHGDDLLDQSCAGPRHADNQHRRRIAVAEFGRPRDQFGCAVDLDRERGRVERRRAPAHGVCGAEMLHGQGVVAKILRRLADSRGEAAGVAPLPAPEWPGRFHPLKQTVVIARDGRHRTRS